jgi:ferredoxin-NADP reductase
MIQYSDWTPVVVHRLRDLTPSVREFELRPSQPGQPHWANGAHLQVQVHVKGQAQMRRYSLTGSLGPSR